MKDATMNAALRFIGKRPFCPGIDYHGNRPNLPWTKFLSRLFPAGHAERPRFRVTRRP